MRDILSCLLRMGNIRPSSLLKPWNLEAILAVSPTRLRMSGIYKKKGIMSKKKITRYRVQTFRGGEVLLFDILEGRAGTEVMKPEPVGA